MKEKGFTLTELLMSIGVVSVLIGLSLPAIKGARDSARNTVCQSNLHNWGLAYGMLVGEADDKFQAWRRWDSHVEMLGEYLQSSPPVISSPTSQNYEHKKPYFCPSDYRTQTEINSTQGLSYESGKFATLWTMNVGNQQGNNRMSLMRREWLEDRLVEVSKDIGTFHHGKRNNAYSDGSVKLDK